MRTKPSPANYVSGGTTRSPFDHCWPGAPYPNQDADESTKELMPESRRTSSGHKRQRNVGVGTRSKANDKVSE